MKSTIKPSEFIRTDLAAENYASETSGKEKGIIFREFEKNGLPVSYLEITSDEGSKCIGKPIGRYYTITTGRIWYAGEEELERASEVIAEIIRSLLPDTSLGCVLICGLGNRSITSDALGPVCVSRINVTRHIRTLNPQLYESLAGGETAAFSPGVIGQTGVETGELICGVCDRIKPSAVIVIDSLAARASERLCSTVQLSDSGISPGSGVGNHRAPINRETVGVPVIALGVPTVVDSSTLVYDALEKAGIDDPGENLRAVLENGRNFFVSLKECDIAVESLASLAASSINIALGNNYS